MNNLIVKHYAGSTAYGTNLPSSDVDFRGIYCDPPRGIITPWSKPRTEQWEDPSEEDTVITELHKYMIGYVNGSPNVLETLWVDPSHVTYSTEVYDYLRLMAPQLLSKKLRYTFGGYALGQMKRIKGHNKWINNPQDIQSPVRSNYFKLIQNLTEDKVFSRDFDILACNGNHVLVPYGNDIYGVVYVCGGDVINKDGSINRLKYENMPDEIKKSVPKYIVKMCEDVYKGDKETHYNYWKWRSERNVIRSAIEAEHGYDCYSSDTEFLTENGWKLFDDIEEHELIATFNKDHTVEYHEAIARIDNMYTGDMYHFTGHHQDTLVTANHHMYARPYSRNKGEPSGNWGGIAACQLPETYEILNVVSPRTTTYEYPVKETAGLDLEVYLRIIGWYLTDGTMEFNDSTPIRAKILCYSKKSPVYQTLVKFMNSAKILCVVSEREYEAGKNEYSFTLPKDIAIALYEDCGHKSKNKRIPKWAFDLTKRMGDHLLKAMIQGDAYKRTHAEEAYSYYTSNSLLADDFQILATLLGYEASKWGPYDHKNQYTDTCKMFHVHVNLLPKITKVNMKQNLKVNKVKNSRVVCFELPNNTVITRRYGKVSLHKQCKHAMHVVRLLKMCGEVLETGQVNVKRPDAQELLDIRGGKWKYEELLEWSEHTDNELNNLMKTSNLPDVVDIELAKTTLIRAEEMVNDSDFV